MITLSNVNKFSSTLTLCGLSDDTKPTDTYISDVNNYKVTNGSIFIEIDSGDMYMFDEENETWVIQTFL